MSTFVNDGAGLVAFDWLVTALLWMSVVTQVAIVRDRSITETRYSDACRWLIAAGMAGIALRFTFVLWDTGDIRLPPFSLISLSLVALGLIGRALEQLARPPKQRRMTDLHPGQWTSVVGRGRE